MGTYNKNFFRCMLKCKEGILKSKNKNAGDVWLEVKTFVEGGSYSSYKKADILARLVLGGYGDSYISRNLGISESTTRVHKRNLSNTLYDVFGVDFFDLLSDYKPNQSEVQKRMDNARNFNCRSVDILSSELIALVGNPVEKLGTYALEDCEREITYLLRYSNASMKRNIRGLDVRKLQFLLGVIDFNTGSSSDRCELLNLLLKEDE